MTSPLPACSFLLLPRLRGRPGGGPLGVTGGCRASPAASASGSGPSPCPLPAGEGLPARAFPSSPSWGSGRPPPSAVSRAIGCANRAGARRGRAGRGAHAGYARKKGPAAGGRPSRRRRGRNGAERNAREGRYAGTEPQSFSGGMRNMTCHDTMQGVFHDIPSPRLLLSSPPPLAGEAGWGPSRRDGRLPSFARRFRERKRPLTLPSPGGRGSSGARVSLLSVMGIGATPAVRRLARNRVREPCRRKTRAGAGAQARYARKKGPAA